MGTVRVKPGWLLGSYYLMDGGTDGGSARARPGARLWAVGSSLPSSGKGAGRWGWSSRGEGEWGPRQTLSRCSGSSENANSTLGRQYTRPQGGRQVTRVRVSWGAHSPEVPLLLRTLVRVAFPTATAHHGPPTGTVLDTAIGCHFHWFSKGKQGSKEAGGEHGDPKKGFLA